MTKKHEIWKPIPNWPFYEISSFGRVKSLARVITRSNGTLQPIRERILRPSKNYGYQHVILYDVTRRTTAEIHVLVLEVFIGPKPFGKEGRHKDRNIHNNKTTNLVWGTHKENIHDAIKHGTLGKGSPGVISGAQKRIGQKRTQETRLRMSAAQYTCWGKRKAKAVTL